MTDIGFSGWIIDYGISDGLKDALNQWEFYEGNHPDGTGNIMHRCNECHSIVRNTDEGKVIHLIQSHGYLSDGRKVDSID